RARLGRERRSRSRCRWVLASKAAARRWFITRVPLALLAAPFAAEAQQRLPALAAELVALKVDVIVALAGTPPALAAKQATTTVPIVFIAVGDPVTSGLVTRLARPGGNVTGLSSLSSELVGKCLELLRQAVPGVDRVAVLWQPGAVG